MWRESISQKKKGPARGVEDTVVAAVSKLSKRAHGAMGATTATNFLFIPHQQSNINMRYTKCVAYSASTADYLRATAPTLPPRISRDRSLLCTGLYTLLTSQFCLIVLDARWISCSCECNLHVLMAFMSHTGDAIRHSTSSSSQRTHISASQ